MFDFLGRYYPAFLEGTAQTIIISIIASIIGISIGLLLVLMRISDNKILATISRVYISVVRGTPSMIQVMLIYYSLSKVLSIPPIHILGASLDRVLPGSIALGLNSGAYTAEIFRSGIISIPKGQTEAGLSLGMTRHMVMFEIVLPQAVRNALPQWETSSSLRSRNLPFCFISAFRKLRHKLWALAERCMTLFLL